MTSGGRWSPTGPLAVLFLAANGRDRRCRWLFRYARLRTTNVVIIVVGTSFWGHRVTGELANHDAVFGDLAADGCRLLAAPQCVNSIVDIFLDGSIECGSVEDVAGEPLCLQCQSLSPQPVSHSLVMGTDYRGLTLPVRDELPLEQQGDEMVRGLSMAFVT